MIRPTHPGALVALLAFAPTAAAHTTEIARLEPAEVQPGDGFGECVGLSLETVAVGAPFHDGAATDGGAVFVYIFNEPTGTWPLQKRLLAPDALAGDELGQACAVDGDTVVVGAPGRDDNGADSGAVYVFFRAGTTWGVQTKLLASDGAAGDGFGSAVAIFGDTVLVGARHADAPGVDSGAAYVFTRSGTTWTEEAKIAASDTTAGDEFGSDVGLAGDSAVVGSPLDDDSGTDSGSGYLFSRTGTTWTEDGKVSPPELESGDLFGTSVDIDDDGLGRAVFGAPGDDSNGLEAGCGYTYENTGTAWTYQGRQLAPNGKSGDNMGTSAGIHDVFRMFGAPFANQGVGFEQSGKVHSYEDFGLNEEIGLLVATLKLKDAYFGTAVDIDGDWIVVGAPGDGGRGAAFIFWRPVQPTTYCTAGASASGCQALISANGYPSAHELTPFILLAINVEGNKDGLFFYGTNGRQANSWGSSTSYQCVVPPVIRTPLQQGTGTVGSCGNTIFYDLNALWCPTCPKPQKNPGAGAIVQAQLWYRDPQNTSNQTTSLSNAIEFGVNP
jgi:hypothetical protein